MAEILHGVIQFYKKNGMAEAAAELEQAETERLAGLPGFEADRPSLPADSITVTNDTKQGPHGKEQVLTITIPKERLYPVGDVYQVSHPALVRLREEYGLPEPVLMGRSTGMVAEAGVDTLHLSKEQLRQFEQDYNFWRQNTPYIAPEHVTKRLDNYTPNPTYPSQQELLTSVQELVAYTGASPMILWAWGANGVGKSHAAVGAGKALLTSSDEGFHAIKLRHVVYVNRETHLMTSPGNPQGKHPLRDYIHHPASERALLIIDDVYPHPDGDMRTLFAEGLAHLSGEKAAQKMIITSNYPPDEILPTLFDDPKEARRILDRVIPFMKVLEVEGPSRRSDTATSPWSQT
jgi:DNA replication protein DnaC